MREKLIELLQSAPADIMGNHGVGALADHLIANGVTFATDNNVGSKWIPVSERLPEKHERVIVCDVREDFCDAWEFEGDGWFNGLWTLETEEVTHWMPMPEPPKEDE